MNGRTLSKLREDVQDIRQRILRQIGLTVLSLYKAIFITLLGRQ